MRAEYADEVVNQAAHPFDGDDEDFMPMAGELHHGIRALVEPLAQFVQKAEALYLRTRPRGVVTITDEHGTRPYSHGPPGE